MRIRKRDRKENRRSERQGGGGVTTEVDESFNPLDSSTFPLWILDIWETFASRFRFQFCLLFIFPIWGHCRYLDGYCEYRYCDEEECK